MEFTIPNFVRSGAVRHLCYYADNLGGTESVWPDVREYAIREFRECPYETILELIAFCKKCYNDGLALSTEVK